MIQQRNVGDSNMASNTALPSADDAEHSDDGKLIAATKKYINRNKCQYHNSNDNISEAIRPYDIT